MPFLMALCVAYWKRKIMSSGCKGKVQKSSACLTMGFVTTICTDLTRKLASQDELEETRKAIRDCQTAGVNVKFISLDDISVVRAAQLLNLESSQKILRQRCLKAKTFEISLKKRG